MAATRSQRLAMLRHASDQATLRMAERDASRPQPIQIGFQAPGFYGFQAQAGGHDVIAARA